MKALVDRHAILVTLFIALALFPTNAFADAICPFATCPGAPLSRSPSEKSVWPEVFAGALKQNGPIMFYGQELPSLLPG